MLKTSIAALAAAPLLASGAAFAGPYVNLEMSGSYPDGAYSSGGVEAVVGYEGTTESGIGWYVLVALQLLTQRLLTSLVM